MITFKINSRIKITPYLEKGFKLYIKLSKNKWICIKFNNVESELINFIMKSIRSK